MLEDSQLTSEERRRARNWHRELLQQMKENASDLADLQSSKFNRAADDLEALYENVRYPRESTLDSLCLDELESSVGRQGRLLSGTDMTKFKTEDLIRASGKVCAAHSELNWGALGNTSGGMFQSVPETNFMFGLLDTTTVKKPSKKRRRLVPNDDNNQETQPREYRDEIENTQGRRLKVLEDAVAKKPGEKVELFDAILDPDSFEQTVVNLFDTSFLVHQGSLGVGLDATGLPFLGRSQIGDSTRDAPDHNRQSIISITPAQWEELANACDQDEPLVGHREEM
eukprot:jgi/Phyca11/110126/e_gw1.18.442.1